MNQLISWTRHVFDRKEFLRSLGLPRGSAITAITYDSRLEQVTVTLPEPDDRKPEAELLREAVSDLVGLAKAIPCECMVCEAVLNRSNLVRKPGDS